MELLFLQITSVAYLIAAALFFYSIVKPSSDGSLSGGSSANASSAQWVMAFGFVVQTASILIHLWSTGLLPVTAFHEGAAFFSWLLVGVYLVAARGLELGVVAAVVNLLAAVLTAIASFSYVEGAVIPPALQSPWLPVHVTLAFLGNAVFAVAFAISAVYLLQERHLKSRSRGWFIRRLPSLEQLDRLNFRCLAWGFPLLTAAILSGGIWAFNAWGRFWSWEAREVASLLTWVIYAGLIQFRLTAGLRGRRAATLTILGFIVVVVSYLSIPFFNLPGRHGGGLGS